MENTGVIFNETKDRQGYSHESFTVTIEGGTADYLDTIKALLNTLIWMDAEMITHQPTRHSVCALILGMLPSEEQMEKLAEMQNIKNLTNKIAELER